MVSSGRNYWPCLSGKHLRKTTVGLSADFHVLRTCTRGHSRQQDNARHGEAFQFLDDGLSTAQLSSGKFF